MSNNMKKSPLFSPGRVSHVIKTSFDSLSLSRFASSFISSSTQISTNIRKSDFNHFINTVINLNSNDFGNVELRVGGSSNAQLSSSFTTFSGHSLKHSKTTGDGSAFNYFSNTTELSVESCTFTSCISNGAPGAIYTTGAITTIMNTVFTTCQFTGSSTLSQPGAVLIHYIASEGDTISPVATLDRVIFTDCTSAGSAAAFASDTLNLNLSMSTVRFQSNPSSTYSPTSVASISNALSISLVSVEFNENTLSTSDSYSHLLIQSANEVSLNSVQFRGETGGNILRFINVNFTTFQNTNFLNCKPTTSNRMAYLSMTSGSGSMEMRSLYFHGGQPNAVQGSLIYHPDVYPNHYIKNRGNIFHDAYSLKSGSLFYPSFYSCEMYDTVTASPTTLSPAATS